MNKTKTNILKICTILIISLVFMIILYWLYPKSQLANSKPIDQSVSSASNSRNQSTVLNQNDEISKLKSLSQNDTEINCELLFDASQQLIINEKTRNCFEYFISQYGENEITTIQGRFQLFVTQHFKIEQQQQILELWSRYLNYREALSQLQLHEAPQDNYQYFQAVFNSMQDLKQKIFSKREIEGLFGAEDVYQQYTLDRMQILENDTLDSIAKAQRLQQRFEQLPLEWQDNLKSLTQLENLAALTQQIKDRNGSAQELREMRQNLVGAAATERLEALDQQRSTWKQRVLSYLNARKMIVDSNLSTVAKDQAIQKLKQQNFQSSQEQQRLHTFEEIYDQGGVLPFSQ